MKLGILACISIIFLLNSCDKTKINSTREMLRHQTNIPQVTILGVFHFAGTSDYSSVSFDDLTSEKRQNEIRELIEVLKRFRPTKILVEYEYQNRKKLDSIYKLYTQGDYELTINEIDQLGFRLADELQHEHIYAIDHRMSLPFEELIEFAQENDSNRFNNFTNKITRQDSIESVVLANRTILEYLAFRNSDKEDLRNKNQYLMETTQFVNDSSNIGVRFTSDWWKRNLMIMSNIKRSTTASDRILVIVGAAHRAILKDFFEDRLDFNYVEILDYLETKN